MKQSQCELLVILITFVVIFHDISRCCASATIIPQFAECNQPFYTKEIYQYPTVETVWEFEEKKTIAAISLPGIGHSGYGEYINFQYKNNSGSNYTKYKFQKVIKGNSTVDICKKGYIQFDEPIDVVNFRIVFDITYKNIHDNIQECGNINPVLYGCKDGSNYTSDDFPVMQGCNQKRPLMLDKKKLSFELGNDESTTVINGSKVEYVMFTEPKAWCVKPLKYVAVNKIDLKSKFLIYSLQVGKYENFAENFQLEYSDDGINWAWYNGEKIFLTSTVYQSSRNTIKPPLLARYLKIYLKPSRDISCFKLQVYGCDAVGGSGSITPSSSKRNTVLVVALVIGLVILILLVGLLVYKRKMFYNLFNCHGQDKHLINNNKNEDNKDSLMGRQGTVASIENYYEPYEDPEKTISDGEKRNSEHYYTSMNGSQDDMANASEVLPHYKVPRDASKHQNIPPSASSEDGIYVTPTTQNEYLLPVDSKRENNAVPLYEEDNHYDALNDEDQNNTEYAHLTG